MNPGRTSASDLRLGRRYRSTRLAESYDVVVIGSGMGGLTTAALLSDIGKRVCVLEQHYTAGGYTHSFERNGYEWDVGVHYIGDVGAPTRTRKMFDYLSSGRLEWAPMDREFDRFYVGDKVFSAHAGKQAFRDNLLRQFPREGAAIDRYMELLKVAAEGLQGFTMGRILKPWQRRLAAPFMKVPELIYRNTYEVLSEITDDQDLIATLCGQWGDMGLPPKRSAFLVHAMIARHYLHGGYYPVGGAWRIAESIIPRIEAPGGDVFTYARVERIAIERGRVSGVEMADGHFIACDTVVSAAGVANTFGRLLSAEDCEAGGYARLLDKTVPSYAHLGVYIGLKASADALGLPKTNFWIYPSNDYDADVAAFEADPDAEFPVVYISFPSAKDPAYEQRHPGTATIEIVAPAPYERFERWEDTHWNRRGAEYERYKQQLGERLLGHLYARLPQLRGKVDFYEVSTPLSTNWFGGYRRGELYGLAHTAERLQADWLRPKTAIRGLWLTGQDILTCGVTGAMMAGLMTTTAMLGMRRAAPLMRRVFGGEGS
ncbi:MAG: NAD(P)/FAD-dependent oxidoreductase [Pseudomonadota bacterium]